ncbi:MAG: hypothetical protein H6581_19305 [Bacteroidia bacterium]|nr:hypothetical protein [Bacteroidia bacterium]
MNKPRILVVDPFPDPFLEEIRQMAGEVRFLCGASPAECLESLPWAEILVINSKINLDRPALDSAPDLKLVCRAGVGLDHIDVPYLEAKGIKLVNAPGANARPVGEQAVGMLLALMHRICVANSQVKDHKWLREANRGTELGGKTVGIIGYGNTGTAFGNCISGFGMEVLAYDKYKNGYGNGHVKESSMEEIFANADVVTLHIPLTAETHYLADATFFERFAKPIYFLNLSRGPVVKTCDLLTFLDNGKVLGAGLDVLENEKLDHLTQVQTEEFEALAARENVILTPHIGGWSFESLDRINNAMLDTICDFISE